jgi:hypothetical protein
MDVGVLVLLTLIASAVCRPCMQLQLTPSRHRNGVPVCGAPASRRPELDESASPHENSVSASMSENRKRGAGAGGKRNACSLFDPRPKAYAKEEIISFL